MSRASTLSGSVLRPDWTASRRVQALVTTRHGGFSKAPYDSLNLALHVGDDQDVVQRNREELSDQLGLPGTPCWLSQVHGTDVIEISASSRPVDAAPEEADAAFSSTPSAICAVMTADCLPVFFTDRQGNWVAVAHAGWRGLLAGVLESTVARYPGRRADLQAWLGPAIGPRAFEVGDEVRDAFVAHSAEAVGAFEARHDSLYCDIYQLARQRLAASGVVSVGGGDLCTHSDAERFYSYRRDGLCGRMASLIWIDGTE